METKFNLTSNTAKLDVYEDRIEIKPTGIFAVVGNGSETIFIKDMTSVQVKECSFINSGFIHFSAPGIAEKDSKVTFGGFDGRKEMNESANKIKTFILSQMQTFKSQPQSITQTAIPSTSDELLKLSKLKDDGVLSPEEFQSAKNKLLGL